MASPTIVSASSNTAASGTSITINAPTSISAGNILVAAIYTAGAGSAPLPPTADGTGFWTQLSISTATVLYIKIATGNEPANYTFTWTTAALTSGIIVNISGGNTGLYDAVANQINAASTNYTAPTITPKKYDNLLLNIYAGATANAITVPGGQSNIGGTTGNSRCIIAGYESLSAAAATGTRVATGTSAVNSGWSIAIRSPDTGIFFESVDLSNGIVLSTSAPNAPVVGLGSGPSVLGIGANNFYGSSDLTGYTLDSGGFPISMYVILEKNSGYSAKSRAFMVVSSAVDGSFTFPKLSSGNYMVWCYDPFAVQVPVMQLDVTVPGSVTLQPASGGGGTPLSQKPLYLTTTGKVAEFPGTVYMFGKTTNLIGDGSSTAIVVTHSLGTRELVVVVRRVASPYDIIDCQVELTSTNTLTLTFTTAPATDEYYVTILG